MSKSEIFKQAIAEAKTIREAAISNAKDALSETLTPAIKELLAKQLEEEEEAEEEVSEEKVVKHTSSPSKDEDWRKSKDLKEAEEEEEEAEEEEEEAEEMPEEEAEDDPGTESGDEAEEEIEDMDMEDLKDLIRDILAQELGDETIPGEEGGIEGMGDEAPDMKDLEPEEDAEEYSLAEMLKELENELTESEEEASIAEEEEIEEDVKFTAEQVAQLKKERDEAVEALQKVTGQLSEVNVLNAKLLYLNKIFKAYTLSENQKAKIVGAFDKATSTKEAKLVYESLTANIGGVEKKESKTIKEHTFASKAAGKAPKKSEILTEDAQTIERWQKIAKIGKYKK